MDRIRSPREEEGSAEKLRREMFNREREREREREIYRN